MRKQGIDGTGMLNLYDRVTGIFNEIFDSRLLTAAIFALIGYCSLFTQRKFPMRWWKARSTAWCRKWNTV